ncbi:hypothetical protein KXX35_009945, partial [Aspergillus fumigatus]
MTGVDAVGLDGVDGVLPESVLFGRYFRDVDRCRSLMKSTGAVASGSAVLHALDSSVRVGSSSPWAPNDLDVFIARRVLRRGALVDWHEYFVGEGYGLCDPVGASGYAGAEVIKYKHVESGRRVDFVIVSSEPLVYIVREFWSTHLMNFATWDGMYCLFPESCLLRKQMCFVRCRSGGELRAYEKYVERGFGRCDMDLSLSLREFESERFVGDELTHRVVFSGVEVEGRVPKSLRSIRFV